MHSFIEATFKQPVTFFVLPYREKMPTRPQEGNCNSSRLSANQPSGLVFRNTNQPFRISGCSPMNCPHPRVLPSLCYLQSILFWRGGVPRRSVSFVLSDMKTVKEQEDGGGRRSMPLLLPRTLGARGGRALIKKLISRPDFYSHPHSAPSWSSGVSRGVDQASIAQTSVDAEASSSCRCSFSSSMA